MVWLRNKNANRGVDPDYTLNNPDVLTKYKDAAVIAHKVLEAVSKLAVDGATILSLCQAGDKMLDEETAKVHKGKKISKGMEILTVYFNLQSPLVDRFTHHH